MTSFTIDPETFKPQVLSLSVLILDVQIQIFARNKFWKFICSLSGAHFVLPFSLLLCSFNFWRKYKTEAKQTQALLQFRENFCNYVWSRASKLRHQMPLHFLCWETWNDSIRNINSYINQHFNSSWISQEKVQTESIYVKSRTLITHSSKTFLFDALKVLNWVI